MCATEAESSTPAKSKNVRWRYRGHFTVEFGDAVDPYAIRMPQESSIEEQRMRIKNGAFEWAPDHITCYGRPDLSDDSRLDQADLICVRNVTGQLVWWNHRRTAPSAE